MSRPLPDTPRAIATAAALVLLSPALAWSQAAAPAAAAAATPEAEPKVETVVIGAQRRLERLQDVPVAVKAFSARQIEATGITSTQDFVNLTPNMSFDNSFTYGNSFVVVRGVTQINNADSPVAVVVDGVPQNSQKQLKMNLFDIERIEVLKGPQGALYGRNAIGGAINIETKKPGNRLEGFGALGFGNGGSKEVSGGVSGALVADKALFRIVGQAKAGDGLITNTFRNAKVDDLSHDNALRAKLLLMPSDRVQLDLRASLVDYNAGATWDSIVPDGKPSTIAQPRSNLLGRTDGKTQDFSFKLQAELSFATLTAITGYTDLSERYRGDLDFSNATDLPGGFLGFGFQAGQGQELKVKMLSQEVRLTSPDDQPMRWIAGGYFLDTKRDLRTRAFVDIDGSLGQIDNSALVIVDKNEHNKNQASALFGQLDYDFDRQWTLSGALRYDRDQRKQTDLTTNALREATFSKWQPKATLTRKFARDTLAYGTVSTGFRSGGFNAPGIADFKPESLTNVEVGYKTVTAGGTLLLNTALFHSRSKGFQYFLVDAKTGSQIIANIDQVTLKGLDLDFRWLPIKGLEFDGGIGITDSTIDRNDSDPSTVGKHTPKNVPFKLNLGVQYSVAVAPGLEASARLDYEHRDRKYWHPDNAAVSPALDLWGLRVGVREARDRWSVMLTGRNLANKKYYADYNASKYSGLPYDLGSLATPRTVGVEAKVRF